MIGQGRQYYTYQPIPNREAIRLLELYDAPDSSIGSLRCKLLTVRLDDTPEYNALSYTWGREKKNVPISVDGFKLLVTPNLAAALQELVLRPGSAAIARRVPDDGIRLRLWVDQICINQDDLEERQDQVQLMHLIYGQSQRTIIWLGPEPADASSALAIDLLHEIEQIYLESGLSGDGRRTFIPFTGPGRIDWEFHKRKLPPTNSKRWRAMYKFLSFPWFRRVWIIQETVLSSQDPVIHCGPYRISFTTAAWACHWLYVKGYIDGVVPQAVKCMHMLLHMRSNQSGYDIGARLLIAMGHFASDPRDNIYGTLGLGNPHPLNASVTRRDSVAPNYTLSAADAYHLSIHYILKKGRGLELLSLPTIRPTGCWDLYRAFGRQAFWKDFSSWVPHLEDVPRPRHFVNFYPRGPEGRFVLGYHPAGKFQASGSPSPENSVLRPSAGQNSLSTLILQGYRIDTAKICLKTGPWPGLARQNRSITDHSIRAGLFRASYYLRECKHWGTKRLVLYNLHTEIVGRQRPYVLRAWETAIEHGKYHDALRIAEAVMDATTAGMDSGYKAWPERSLPNFCAFMSDMNRRWPKRGASDALKKANKIIAENNLADARGSQRYAVSAQYWCGLRRFFVTSQGYIGIGPSSMRQGDVICLILGSGVPFVLRRHQSHWLYIGDCYVHELGDGSLFEGLQRSGLAKERFELR